MYRDMEVSSVEVPTVTSRPTDLALKEQHRGSHWHSVIQHHSGVLAGGRLRSSVIARQRDLFFDPVLLISAGQARDEAAYLETGAKICCSSVSAHL